LESTSLAQNRLWWFYCAPVFVSVAPWAVDMLFGGYRFLGKYFLSSRQLWGFYCAPVGGYRFLGKYFLSSEQAVGVLLCPCVC
jgi:hypothetical protein